VELRRLKRDVLYRGKVFDLIVDQVEYPSGNRGVREIARHPGGAVVVPVFDDMTVLLVQQLRYPLERHIVELPAGKLSPGEDPLLAARRELEEETGYTSDTMEKIVSIYTTPGFCDEELHLYLARGLRLSPQGHRREEGEFSMTLLTLPLAEAIRRVRTSELQDAKTIIGLLLAERILSERTSRPSA